MMGSLPFVHRCSLNINGELLPSKRPEFSRLLFYPNMFDMQCVGLDPVPKRFRNAPTFYSLV